MAKNKFKKIRLKRAKEDKALKSKLKADIAQFLCDMHYCISNNLERDFSSMIAEGHKGYNNMRNKELIGELECAYELLNRPKKEQLKFYAYVEEQDYVNRGCFRYRGAEGDYAKRTSEEIHLDFLGRVESLVSQVLDAIIGLEREDAEGSPPRKAYQRGLPIDDLDDLGCNS